MTANIAMVRISMSKCSLLRSILGSSTASKCSAIPTFEFIFMTGQRSFGFLHHSTAFNLSTINLDAFALMKCKQILRFVN